MAKNIFSQMSRSGYTSTYICNICMYICLFIYLFIYTYNDILNNAEAINVEVMLRIYA